MKRPLLLGFLISVSPLLAQTPSAQDSYVITKHVSVTSHNCWHDSAWTVVNVNGKPVVRKEEQYTIAHGTEILKMRYSESQTDTSPGDAIVTADGIHDHYCDDPDLSQIPKIGVAIRGCVMDGDAVAHQPTPAPCMAEHDERLIYYPAPNSGRFDFVVFEILSEEAAKPPTTARGQSVMPNKGVPTIAKEAIGAVVSIVMADKSGQPIAQGSGFVVSRDGRIVTNYHVIKNGASAIVKLPDGSFFNVDGVLAFDKKRDIALIKAHGNNFKTVALGDSDQLQIGEEVVAIGSPLSLESTVSNGIVSGIRSDEEEGSGRKLLQITAPISHGSSGGPLFNMFGQAVGITSAALTGGENLNFAVPINDVKSLLAADLQAFPTFPDEPDTDVEEHAAADDPILLDEDVPTGFAEIFSLEPSCAGLTLERKWSPPGFWALRITHRHEIHITSWGSEQDPNGRTFLSWEYLTHYTANEHNCATDAVKEPCLHRDKEFAVYTLIQRDADNIPKNYCPFCTTSTQASLMAGAKAVCALVKGGGGGKVK